MQQSRGRMSACFLPPVLLPTPLLSPQYSLLSTESALRLRFAACGLAQLGDGGEGLPLWVRWIPAIRSRSNLKPALANR